MRILINATTAKMGGAVSYLKSLIDHLAKLDSGDQFIIYASGSFLGDKDLPPNIHLRHCGYHSFFALFWWQQLVLPRIIKREKINVLFSTANFATFLCSFFQILLVRDARYFSEFYAKNVLSKKNLFLVLAFFLRRFLIVFSAKRADILVFPSRTLALDFQKYVPCKESKIVIDYYGVDTDRFLNTRNTQEKTKEKINILYSGLYGEHKNLKTLFEALLLLRSGGFGDFLLTAPIDWSNRLNKKCVTYREDFALASNPLIKENLNFIDNINYGEIEKIYRDADIFIWPTLTESFGHPLVEAMASGLPVIASDIAINKEICADSAIYFSPLDSRDLAKKIKILIDDPILREKLRKRGKNRVEIFRWDDHVKRLLELFKTAKNIS